MSTINDRIKLIVNQMFNGNTSEFERASKINPSTVKNIIGGRLTKPSYDVLEAIIRNNVLLSAEWLMRGEGDMLKQSGDGDMIISNDLSPSDKDHEIDILKKYLKFSKETIDKLRSTIAGLEDEIIKLRSEIEVIKEDNNRSSGIG